MATCNTIAAVLLSGLLCAAPVFAQSAGRVLAVAGEASFERLGQKQPLQRGSEVQNGDVLTVGDKSALQVRFTDESIVALKANTQLKIMDYRYAQDAVADRSIMSLLRGGLRTITGLIGKVNPRAYGVQTVTATIGIRGTHFSLVACNDDCLNPDGSAAVNGLFGGVTDGRISVTNNAGETEFDQQEYFYLASADVAPQRLLTPPPLLNDRALVVRARNTGSNADASAGTDSKTEQRSGSTASTAPQTANPRLQSIDLQTLKALAASGQAPGLVDYLIAQNNVISFVNAQERTFFGSNTLAAETSGESLTVREVRAQIDNLKDRFFYNAETMAVQLSKDFVVESNKSAGVYWVYAPPDANTLGLLGSHHAFGDAPKAALPSTGLAVYGFVGGTVPTDSGGRTGTLTAGRLGMDFTSQQIKTLDPISLTFPRTGVSGSIQYSLPTGSLWSMSTATQNLADLRCQGCGGTAVGSINGRFVGLNAQGYAASIAVQTVVGGLSQVNPVAGAALGFGRQ